MGIKVPQHGRREWRKIIPSTVKYINIAGIICDLWPLVVKDVLLATCTGRTLCFAASHSR